MATGLYSKLDELIAAYPALVPVDTVIGQSHEGRDIRAVHITAGSNKPQIGIIAAQHAAEWLAHHGTLYMIEVFLTQAGVDRRVYDLLANHELVIVPVMNPDGYVFARTPGNRQWRKNRRNNGDGTFGVDTNRNWGTNWGGGSNVTSETTYQGPSAQSEPEVKATDAYMKGLRDLRFGLDIHTINGDYGTYEGYFAYSSLNVPGAIQTDLRTLRGKLKAACDANGFIQYDIGDNFITNTGGILRNHFYSGFGVPGFLMECHADSGFVAPAADIIPQGKDILTAVLTIAEHYNFT